MAIGAKIEIDAVFEDRHKVVDVLRSIADRIATGEDSFSPRHPDEIPFIVGDVVVTQRGRI